MIQTSPTSRRETTFTVPPVKICSRITRSTFAAAVRVLGGFVLVVAVGCVHKPLVGRSGEVQPWPKDWSVLLGRSVTIEGTAVNAKLGALLLGEGEIWIDGLDGWPEGFYLGGDKGKRVRVTGIVIEKHDLPVFVPKPGELPRTGMPVPEGTDLNEASQRFLLKDARWTLIE
jgi:hypothetical protein